MLCQAIALGISPLLPLSAMAQAPATSAGTTTPVVSGNTTILPTDVVPLTDRDAYKTPIGELLQLKVMQRLPANLYFSSSVEITGRNETNPFQFPTKRRLMADLPRPAQWRVLNEQQQASLYDIIGQVARNNMVFRALPNVSGGWAFTPHTRLFTNYFMIRDQLAHSMRLNTVIHSYAIGLQHDMPVGAKGSLQFEFQGRELWQLHQQSVFDFLPGVTFSYLASPRTVLFVNALIQARGKAPFQAPTKELDPFYTWGGLYQKNGWTFSASTTFVQNFREPFHHNATTPKNSYVFISDFEIARRVLKQYPGLQAFVRAEPIWNFHASNIPSLAGMDFRLFFGMRFAMAKPPLTATLQQIREQLKQEGEENPGGQTKPSAEAEPEHPIAQNPQPIHGFLESSTLAETCQLPEGELPVIADEPSYDSEQQTPNVVAKDSANEEQRIANAANSNSSESQAATTQSESASSTDAARTLDVIAQEASTSGSGGQSSNTTAPDKVADLSNTQLDWNDVSEVPTLGAASSSDLHDIVQSAVVSSSSVGAQARTEEIQKLAEKHEQEYKLSFAPPPVAFKAPASAMVAAPAPKAVTVSTNNAAAMPKPSTSELKALPQVLELGKLASKATASPAIAPAAMPSSLGHGTAPVQPSSHPALAYVPGVQTPAVQAPELSSAQKLIQPIERSKAEPSLVLSAPMTQVQSTKRLIQPVPIASRSNLTPNAVPTPVTKAPSLASIIPQLKQEKSKLLDETPVLEKSAPVQHLANKDGSIPVSEAKMDQLPVQAKVTTKQEPKLAQLDLKKPSVDAAPKPAIEQIAKTDLAFKQTAVESTKTVVAQNTPAIKQNITATPAIQTLASNTKASATMAALPVQTAPANTKSLQSNRDLLASASVIQSTIQTPSNDFGKVVKSIQQPAQKPAQTIASNSTVVNKAPRIQLSKPVLPTPEQLRMEENANAISGLENDICSPKIAMAVYDSWKSPVLDDPLISMDGAAGSSKGDDLDIPVSPAKQQKGEKKKTDMRLIPPFPTTNGSSKDNPLKDLQIPVLPMH